MDIESLTKQQVCRLGSFLLCKNSENLLILDYTGMSDCSIRV